MKVKLTFESPLIVGDKRLKTNYIQSKDYIQGSVVRAAFVRVILNHCIADKTVEELLSTGPSKGKRNWVYYRDQEVCQTCRYASICKKFGEGKVNFSFFYPVGTQVIPLTSMICKNNPKAHGFIDSLTHQATCEACSKANPENARVEFISGLRNEAGEYKVPKLTQTKTAINPYTKTAMESQLYSLTSVIDTNFEGEIEGLDEEELVLFKNLRVGAYTSTGYGKCKIGVSATERKIVSLEQVQRFSEQYVCHNERTIKDKTIKDNQLEDKHFMALLLTADAHLDVEEVAGYQTTKQYIDIWQKYLGLNDADSAQTHQEVYKVYFDTSLYRGYDTSINTKQANGQPRKNGYRAQPQYQISKGGVIVLAIDKGYLEAAYDQYRHGGYIGNHNENGYGRYEIYCGEED